MSRFASLSHYAATSPKRQNGSRCFKIYYDICVLLQHSYSDHRIITFASKAVLCMSPSGPLASRGNKKAENDKLSVEG